MLDSSTKKRQAVRQGQPICGVEQAMDGRRVAGVCLANGMEMSASVMLELQCAFL
jgi:hypothetical protein